MSYEEVVTDNPLRNGRMKELEIAGYLAEIEGYLSSPETARENDKRINELLLDNIIPSTEQPHTKGIEDWINRIFQKLNELGLGVV